MTVSATERSSALKFIVCLGFVSFFADMTYEGAYSIIGPLLKDLGANATEVGIIAGLGEMVAASLRFFSGKLADRTRAYWSIALLGYIMNLVVVPLLAFAGNWQAAALLVVAERTGKSLRGPARDVLLSDATKSVGHGWGFGIHAAFDQAGALLGPLFVWFAVARSHHFAPAMLWLAFPAAGALIALLVAKAMHPTQGTPPTPPKPRPLPRVFWIYVAAAGLLACGYVDFPLMAYHFQKSQLATQTEIPLLYAGAMGVVGLAALLSGKLFDRFGIPVLSAGIIISLMTLPLAFLGGRIAIVASVICWGIGIGVQDGTLRSAIAQVVSMNKRGGAFGSFNGVWGVMWFVGSSAMGFLYDRSIIALVVFGVVLQLIAATAFVWLHKPLRAAAE